MLNHAVLLVRQHQLRACRERASAVYRPHLGWLVEEGHSFLSPTFLHLFVAFLFFILEFVASWELRHRDHLRSWKVSFLTSCHMICLILTSGNSRGTSLLTTGRGSMQLLYSVVLAPFIRA